MTAAADDSSEYEGDESDDLFFLSMGPLAAILLGMGLVPLRGFTVASNFTFVFVALTIVVAEFGGRRAAFATAVTSTLSLDFFLTEPYLRLAIASKHDVIAFCGLAVCGALAAGLASGRGRRQQALRNARAHLDLLHAGIREVDEAGFTRQGVERLVDTFRGLAPLAAVAVRDEGGNLMASSGDGAARTVPHEVLRPEELLVVSSGPPRILPPEGKRIPLRAGARLVGSLDVWGAETPLSVEACRLLGDLAILLGACLGHGSAVSG
jgi:hypothetical protein